MRLIARALLVLMVLGCSGNKKPAKPRVEPPELVTRTRPSLRTPPSSGRQGVVLDLRLEVLIAATGQPDMTTMRLTGIGAADNQVIVEEWLRASRFRPATQAGIPVAATYRAGWRAESRTVIRRQLEE